MGPRDALVECCNDKCQDDDGHLKAVRVVVLYCLHFDSSSA